MPATMLVTAFPPAGRFAGSGTGATPMSSGFMPSCLSEAWAACQKTIEVVPVAKSFSASVPFEYWASLAVSYTHLRAHETDSYLVCRLLLEKKKKIKKVRIKWHRATQDAKLTHQQRTYR